MYKSTEGKKEKYRVQMDGRRRANQDGYAVRVRGRAEPEDKTVYERRIAVRRGRCGGDRGCCASAAIEDRGQRGEDEVRDLTIRREVGAMHWMDGMDAEIIGCVVSGCVGGGKAQDVGMRWTSSACMRKTRTADRDDDGTRL